MRSLLTIGGLGLLGLMLVGCNLRLGQPTPTPPGNVPLITTLPPDTLPDLNIPPSSDFAPVTQGTPINPDCALTPSTWISYTVESGDSLGLLAEQTSSSLDELVAGNCLTNPDSLFVGQVIYLPRQPVISP
jgi:hypothetical protein